MDRFIGGNAKTEVRQQLIAVASYGGRVGNLKINNLISVGLLEMALIRREICVEHRQITNYLPPVWLRWRRLQGHSVTQCESHHFAWSARVILAYSENVARVDQEGISEGFLHSQLHYDCMQRYLPKRKRDWCGISIPRRQNSTYSAMLQLIQCRCKILFGSAFD